MNLLVFDTETGGLDPKEHSLLTAYFCIVDKDWNILDELDLKVKPDDGVYNVQEAAMKINKIDLEEHDKIAITYSEAKKLLKEFLQRNKIKGKRNHFMPMGQNINFDIGFIKATILPEKDYKASGINYSFLDTKQLVDYLKWSGIFPDSMRTNLGAIVDYLGLPKRNAHEAKDDVLMTIDVFKGLTDLFREKAKGSSSLKTKLLLGSIEGWARFL